MSSRKKTAIRSIARKANEKAELREMILETARKLVLQKGFAELSIRKLADTIGYAPGTIYLYFKNRDEITREICVRGFTQLYEEMKSVADLADPQQRLTALLQAYAHFAIQNPETYRLSFMEDPKFTEEMFRSAPLELEDGAGRQAFASIVKAVRDLKQADKLISEEEAILLAEMLWTGVHGVVSLKLIYPAFPTHSTDTLVNKMIETMLKGMQ